jgi:hypothetical protein
MNRGDEIKKQVDEIVDWHSNKENRKADGLRPLSQSEQERLRAWVERTVRKDVEKQERMERNNEHS